MTKDLTCGNPQSILWHFTMPMFLSVIFQQLYNIADSVIAGKFAGEDALAAVGASYPITMIFMAIAVGSNIGCSVIISQLFGGKQYIKMKTAVTTTLISSVILSIILTIAGLLGSKGLMLLIKTPSNIFSDGELYLKIYIGGFLFLFLYNISTGIFTSLGDSKTPLYFLIASSVGNILLDLLFVAIFHWGVAGVAWATFIAQGISCLLSFVTVLKRLSSIDTDSTASTTSTNTTTITAALFSFPMLGKIASIAIPSILQQSFVSIGNIFIQSLINAYGSSIIAGYSAAIKLNTFMITSFSTLGNGISSFAAQNIGAGKTDRVKDGFKASVTFALMIALPFFIVFFFFPKYMILLFLSAESDLALHTGITFLRCVSPFYFVICLKLMADGVLRGAGAVKAFMATTFSDLILRVILSFVLAAPFGVNGIWYSWPIGWSISTILSLFFYFKGVWKVNL